MGGRRANRDVLEQRRLQAARLFEKGVRPAEVARRLGVSRQSATSWQHAWEDEGVRGLRQAERTGRPPLLDGKELKAVERALVKGPSAYGWSSQLWTLERVADVIAIETGSGTTSATSGSCSGGWGGAGRSRLGGRSSATSRRSCAGSKRSGPS